MKTDTGRWIVEGEAALRAAAVVGGKAAHLARLERLGLPVPPWYALTTAAFEGALARLGGREVLTRRLEEAAREGAAALAAAGAAIRRAFTEGEVSAALAVSIAERIALEVPRRFSPGSAVAVRSSAVGEDAAGASFAGLHDSFLFVRGEAELARAVLGVWASAFNERALAYRQAKGISFRAISVAVIVQEMIDARASGVAFTANPTTGHVHELVVSAVYGAGEGLVSAGLAADTWTVEKERVPRSVAAWLARGARPARGPGEQPLAFAATDRGTRSSSTVWRADIAVKEEQLVVNPETGRGLVRAEVPLELREAPALSEEELSRLGRVCLLIERGFGRPQDIEWALDRSGDLYVLQARPITTVRELGPAAGNALLWDNSNIIESYSGVTSPMTFSFIRRAYAVVYHGFAEVMGIDERTIAAHQPVFANMLGLFRGQVYYNLKNWYRVVKLFPGYEFNRGAMESMMGVRESAMLGEEPDFSREGAPSLRSAITFAARASCAPLQEGAPSRAKTGWLRRYFVELPKLLRLVVRTGGNFWRIRRIVGDFQAYFEACFTRWSAIDLDALRPHERMALYFEMEDQLLARWKPPIINDFFVMIFYGLLKKLCAGWCGDENGSLQNDLLSGEGGIESTEPARLLGELAALAARTPELREMLLERPSEQLATTVPGDARFTEFNEALAAYLERYGCRSVGELKLEEPSLEENPAFVYAILRNYLAAGPPDPAAEQNEGKLRREAEARAARALAGHPLRRMIFRQVLANARMGVKNRENLRFARSRIYGLFRKLLQAAGRHLAAEGLLASTEDVFYLTLDELWDFIRGTAVTTDLRGLVEVRRREFESYRAQPELMPDDRFETYGMAYHRNDFRQRVVLNEAPVLSEAKELGDGDEPGTLRGIPCCPGLLEHEVKVIVSPSTDARLDGEILVAGRTDPGWVPLYPSAKGLLIERGSILSHSAIVAREMGLPTIVNIPGLLKTLETGDRVRMDGAAGTVVRVG